MKRRTNHYPLLLIMFFMISLELPAQKVEVIKATQLYKMIDDCDADLCIFNFWATWCAACIRELPQFEKLSEFYSHVKVKLISLDDIDDLNTKVKQFLTKRNIHSEVLLLDETDFNEIIPRIDDSWSGAIPATLIVSRDGIKHFYEKEFKEGELEQTTQKLNNFQN